MKTVYFSGVLARSGIDVTYVKKDMTIRISGWYDGFVGIEPVTLPLAEFLTKIGAGADFGPRRRAS